MICVLPVDVLLHVSPSCLSAVYPLANVQMCIVRKGFRAVDSVCVYFTTATLNTCVRISEQVHELSDLYREDIAFVAFERDRFDPQELKLDPDGQYIYESVYLINNFTLMNDTVCHTSSCTL